MRAKKKNLTENKADLFYGFPILRLKIPSISFSFFKVYSIAYGLWRKKNIGNVCLDCHYNF